MSQAMGKSILILILRIESRKAARIHIFAFKLYSFNLATKLLPPHFPPASSILSQFRLIKGGLGQFMGDMLISGHQLEWTKHYKSELLLIGCLDHFGSLSSLKQSTSNSKQLFQTEGIFKMVKTSHFELDIVVCFNHNTTIATSY